jgi:hypothetical protein
MVKKKKGRIRLTDLMEATEEMVTNEEFMKKSKKKASDFTRKRKMPFVKLVMFMLNQIKSSIQSCLDKFFDDTEQGEIRMSEQSFSEARSKIKWETFSELHKMTVKLTYTGYYEMWHGYRVLAVDGTKLQLPSENGLREYFGAIGQGATAVTGQASALYDVYNKVVLDARLEPLRTSEIELAKAHIYELCSLPSFGKECILFDRGYASFDLIETLIACKVSFVIRVKNNYFNGRINNLEVGDHSTTLSKKGHASIPVRVLKFVLPSGEIETLVTNIYDKRMGINGFKALYFKRWPIETKYDELKNKLEVENFSGRTFNAVTQDFFITMYMANVVAAACWEAQTTVDDERAGKDNIYQYHVNVNHAIGTLKDRFILAMIEPNLKKRKKLISHILTLLCHHVVPFRPKRSIPRKSHPRDANFYHNLKSNCR